MPRATNTDGSLRQLSRAKLTTPYEEPYDEIIFRVLPKITDAKSATYNAEPLPGRSTPLITYSHSDARTIQTEFTFIITKCEDIEYNLRALRILKSLVYPGDPEMIDTDVAPYMPPPICRLECGKMLDNGNYSEFVLSDYTDADTDNVCVLMKNYSLSLDPTVAWDEDTYLPYSVNMSCNWEVVYRCVDLPTNQIIRGLKSGQWPCPAEEEF